MKHIKRFFKALFVGTVALIVVLSAVAILEILAVSAPIVLLLLLALLLGYVFIAFWR